MRITRTRIGALCLTGAIGAGLCVAGVELEARAGRQAAAAPSEGRQDPTPPAGTPNRPNRAQSQDANTVPTGELVNMLDTYAIVQAQQALALDDDKYGQFVARLKRLQEARRRNQRERNQILQDLRRLAGPQAPTPVDETIVRERLRTLRDHDERAAAEMRKAYDALDEVLDVRQQARFRLFEETIERRKLDLLMRARERAARDGGR